MRLPKAFFPILAIEVKRRTDDVTRRLLAQLQNVFAEIGLDRRNAVLLQVVVDCDLLRDHRLALGDRLRAGLLADRENRLTGVGGGGAPMNLAARPLDVCRPCLEIEVEIGERMILDVARDIAQALELRQGGSGGCPAGARLWARARQR